MADPAGAAPVDAARRVAHETGSNSEYVWLLWRKGYAGYTKTFNVPELRPEANREDDWAIVTQRIAQLETRRRWHADARELREAPPRPETTVSSNDEVTP
jgi:hypothetical protein